MSPNRVLIMGAAGRDFHNFNTVFRDNEDYTVVAFTATRWGTLLKPHEGWQGKPPTAADCYRFCLAQPAVQIVLTAPRSLQELNANLAALDSPPMRRRECAKLEKYGDLVYGHGRDKFETEWP